MLPILALILGPPFLAALLGALQLLVYKALVRSGRMQDEDAPPFPILMLRGFFVILALVAAAALLSFLTRSGPDPLWERSGAPSAPARPAGQPR